MLEKIKVLNKVEILENGHIQVRYATRIMEDGVQVGSDTYHRESYEPGAELPVEIASKINVDVVWSPEVVTAFEAIKKTPLTP